MYFMLKFYFYEFFACVKRERGGVDFATFSAYCLKGKIKLEVKLITTTGHIL